MFPGFSSLITKTLSAQRRPVCRLSLLLVSASLPTGAAPRTQADYRSDTTPPNIAFSTPRPGQTLTYLRPVFGWVKDNPGGSGISRVIVHLQRRSRGKTIPWEGYEWPHRDSYPKDVWWYFADLLGQRWSYNGLPSRSIQIGGHGTPQIGPKLFSGLYKFTATAYDRAGNSKSITMSVHVVADMTLPRASFLWPRPGAAIKTLPKIEGRATEHGGSGLQRVEISLWRERDSKWWMGTKWRALYSAAIPTLPATLSGGRWQVTCGLPTAANLPDGKYEIAVYAYDRAGNRNGLRFFDEGYNADGGHSTGVTDTGAVAKVVVRGKR